MPAPLPPPGRRFGDQPLDLIELIANSTDLIELLGASAALARSTTKAIDPGSLLDRLVELADVDDLATLAVVEALATLRHTDADRRLARYLDDDRPLVRRHAAWRLRHRTPHEAAYRRLTRLATAGGITTMHAARTLQAWADGDPFEITGAVIDEFEAATAPEARARLVDVLGIIVNPWTDRALIGVASDPNEVGAARMAAVGALGQRPSANPQGILLSLASVDDELAAHAALAIDDLEALDRTTSGSSAPSASFTSAEQTPMAEGRGLRIAQLTLTGELDPQLSRGGRGDTGGVGSLLVSAGEALAARHDVDHVLTIGRGSLTDVVADQLVPDDGKLAYGTISVGDPARPPDSASLWEHLPTIERGIARVLRNREAVDVLHLRMADVGTLAGMVVADEFGIETCFSLAGDPHNVIRSLQDQGHLDRSTFVDRSTSDNLWFRARLVERLAVEADQLALFPRSGERFVDTGSAVDVEGERSSRADDTGRRSIVVPEGIDLGLVRRAERSLWSGTERDPASDVLAELAGRIPTDRRQLPLLVSVGRFNPIKGMDRVAGAWAADPTLYETCSLVIVGGSLNEPTPTEAGVLASIERAVPDGHPARAGLVLLGGRPRFEVACLLAAASAGLPGSWAPGGVYVDGAAKEEFGLALIEALASGLMVVGPNAGGPPTYVEHGVTGVLVDPTDDLAPGIRTAFELVDRPGRAKRSRQLVEDRYSIETMADRLVALYRRETVLL